MKTEDYLEKARKGYLKQVPPNTADSSWQNLLTRINSEGKTSHIYWPTFARAVAFSLILIFISGSSIVSAVQKTNPGDRLYPVKLLSEDIYVKITGDPTQKAQTRATELINLTTLGSNKADEAQKEYQKTLEETKNKIVKSNKPGEKEEFKKNLDSQIESFRQAQEKRPEIKNELDQAINAAENTRGEIKGDRNKQDD